MMMIMVIIQLYIIYVLARHKANYRGAQEHKENTKIQTANENTYKRGNKNHT